MSEYLTSSNLLKVHPSKVRLKQDDADGKQFVYPFKIDKDVANYLSAFVKISDERVLVLDTRWEYDIDKIGKKQNCIINLKRINDFRYINKYLELVNSKIEKNGMFIGCVETSVERKKRIFAKYPAFYAHPFYVGTFIMKRFFPKWGPTKKLYFWITKGENRYISQAEILGRLISCGFSIYDYKEINNRLYYVVKKIGKPKFDKSPTYGALIKLNRIGKKGKTINVYKFRSMHPYSEYLQSYIYEQNNLKNVGKFNNDFRITTIGKFIIKYWIDEIPMIYNLLKFDLKIIGVRPISPQYLSLYSEKLIKKRFTHKPGLLPPFYADLPNTLDEIMDSEEKYLDAYDKQPVRTDIKYGIKIVVNILFKYGRSS